jgi:hypothetical protein
VKYYDFQIGELGMKKVCQTLVAAYLVGLAQFASAGTITGKIDSLYSDLFGNDYIVEMDPSATSVDGMASCPVVGFHVEDSSNSWRILNMLTEAFNNRRDVTIWFADNADCVSAVLVRVYYHPQ